MTRLRTHHNRRRKARQLARILAAARGPASPGHVRRQRKRAKAERQAAHDARRAYRGRFMAPGWFWETTHDGRERPDHGRGQRASLIIWDDADYWPGATIPDPYPRRCVPPVPVTSYGDYDRPQPRPGYDFHAADVAFQRATAEAVGIPAHILFPDPRPTMAELADQIQAAMNLTPEAAKGVAAGIYAESATTRYRKD